MPRFPHLKVNVMEAAMIRPLVALLILALTVSPSPVAASFTIKKLSSMASSSVNPSVSDDGCYVAFEDGPYLKLYDCNIDSATTITEGSEPSMSGNGLWLAFSTKLKLVPADTNSCRDVYLYDRVGKGFTLVSTAYNFAAGNDVSFSPAISTTGRYIAFESWADNLVDGDINHSSDIFYRDLEQPVADIKLVSVSVGSKQGNSNSRNPSISGMGERVAFHSAASNLVPNDTNGVDDVFVRDLNLPTTYRASTSTSGVQANGASGTPVMSGDGVNVAFSSLASNLVSGDGNDAMDVFMKNIDTGTVRLVSANTSGGVGNAASGCNDASFSLSCLGISGSGRFVSFPSAATDLVAADTNGYIDVFLRDTEAGSTQIVSGWDGTPGDDDSDISSMSSSGRFIALDSQAALVGSHFESDWDVFLVDRGEDLPQDVFPIMEDFSNAERTKDPDWTVKSGRWSVNSSREYVSAAGRNSLSLLKVLAEKPYKFTSGRIEVELKVSKNKRSSARAGIVFGYQGAQKYRYVLIRPKQIRIGQIGKFSGNRTLVRVKKTKRIKANVKYTLRVDVKTDGLTNVYLDDTLLMSYRFKTSVGGAVGLHSYLMRSFVSSVHVWDDTIF